MTSSTTRPSSDELREEIAQHEQTITELEREIGAATLDGRSTAPIAKRAQEARASIERCEAALAELVRREASESEQERAAAASTRRLHEYQFVVEYFNRVEVMMAAQEAARAAEDELLALHGAPASRRFREIWWGIRGTLDAESIDLDADVVSEVPPLPRIAKPGPRQEPVKVGGEGFTVEVVRKIRALAKQRAAEEQAGEGIDFSGVNSTMSRQRAERRAAQRAANKAQQERELAERCTIASEDGSS